MADISKLEFQVNVKGGAKSASQLKSIASSITSIAKTVSPTKKKLQELNTANMSLSKSISALTKLQRPLETEFIKNKKAMASNSTSLEQLQARLKGTKGALQLVSQEVKSQVGTQKSLTKVRANDTAGLVAQKKIGDQAYNSYKQRTAAIKAQIPKLQTAIAVQKKYNAAVKEEEKKKLAETAQPKKVEQKATIQLAEAMKRLRTEQQNLTTTTLKSNAALKNKARTENTLTSMLKENQEQTKRAKTVLRENISAYKSLIKVKDNDSKASKLQKNQLRQIISETQNYIKYSESREQKLKSAIVKQKQFTKELKDAAAAEKAAAMAKKANEKNLVNLDKKLKAVNKANSLLSSTTKSTTTTSKNHRKALKELGAVVGSNQEALRKYAQLMRSTEGTINSLGKASKYDTKETMAKRKALLKVNEELKKNVKNTQNSIAASQRRIKALKQERAETLRMANSISAFSDRLNSIGRRMTLFVTGPLALLTKKAIKFAAEVEAQQISLGILLQDMDKGAKMYEELIEFSALTPFQLPDLAKQTRELLAFGSSAEVVVDELRRLGDLAQGDAEHLSGVVRAFGKVEARGTAHMRELNRFIMAGVPIFSELQNVLALDTNAFFSAVRANEVTFRAIKQAVVNLTDAGGRFYMMTEQIAKIAKGRMTTAIDNFNLALRSLVDDNLEDINMLLARFIDIMRAIQNSSQATKDFIKVSLGIAALIGPLARIVGMFGNLSSWILTLGGPKALAIGAVVTLIAALAGGILKLKNVLRDTVSDYENMVHLMSEWEKNPPDYSEVKKQIKGVSEETWNAVVASEQFQVLMNNVSVLDTYATKLDTLTESLKGFSDEQSMANIGTFIKLLLTDAEVRSAAWDKLKNTLGMVRKSRQDDDPTVQPEDTRYIQNLAEALFSPEGMRQIIEDATEEYRLLRAETNKRLQAEAEEGKETVVKKYETFWEATKRAALSSTAAEALGERTGSIEADAEALVTSLSSSIEANIVTASGQLVAFVNENAKLTKESILNTVEDYGRGMENVEDVLFRPFDISSEGANKAKEEFQKMLGIFSFEEILGKADSELFFDQYNLNEYRDEIISAIRAFTNLPVDKEITEFWKAFRDNMTAQMETTQRNIIREAQIASRGENLLDILLGIEESPEKFSMLELIGYDKKLLQGELDILVEDFSGALSKLISDANEEGRVFESLDEAIASGDFEILIEQIRKVYEDFKQLEEVEVFQTQKEDLLELGKTLGFTKQELESLFNIDMPTLKVLEGLSVEDIRAITDSMEDAEEKLSMLQSTLSSVEGVENIKSLFNELMNLTEIMSIAGDNLSPALKTAADLAVKDLKGQIFSAFEALRAAEIDLEPFYKAFEEEFAKIGINSIDELINKLKELKEELKDDSTWWDKAFTSLGEALGETFNLKGFEEGSENAKDNAESLGNSIKGIVFGLGQAVGPEISKGLEDLGEAFATGEDNSKDWEDTLANMKTAFINALPMLLLQGGLQLLATDAWPIGLGLILASGAASFVKGAYNASNSGDTEAPTLPMQTQIASTSAKGNAFNNGMIVDRLSGLSSDRGVHIIGESGNEAVLPLKRTASGELGVLSTGRSKDSSSTAVSVNMPVEINNTVSDEVGVETQQTMDSNGNQKLEITVHKIVNKGMIEGRYKKSMNLAYGTQYRGV